MPWVTLASHAWLATALSSDIARELTAADYYLKLARLVKQLHNPPICRQIAVCSATALSNATALAAELMALGGAPPASPPARPGTLPAPTSVAEHLMDARADLAHYHGRLVFARRLELPRLQEVFWDIVLSKRRHLAHAGVVASACATRRSTKSKWGEF